jgi:hypothetical protein
MNAKTYNSTYKKIKHNRKGGMDELYELLDNEHYDQVLYLITHMARAVSVKFMERCLIFQLVKQIKKDKNQAYFDIVLDIIVYFLYDYHYIARGNWIKLNQYLRASLFKNGKTVFEYTGSLLVREYSIRDSLINNYNIEPYHKNLII